MLEELLASRRAVAAQIREDAKTLLKETMRWQDHLAGNSIRQAAREANELFELADRIEAWSNKKESPDAGRQT